MAECWGEIPKMQDVTPFVYFVMFLFLSITVCMGVRLHVWELCKCVPFMWGRDWQVHDVGR